MKEKKPHAVKEKKPRKPANIILVGFMGTGKTSVGKLVAEKLNMTFVDMDGIIERREGKSVSRIFGEDGEPRFRALERKLVRELSAKSGLVIATGGGIVLDPENIKDFSRAGLVACLQAEPVAILKRLEADDSRPLLEGENKMKQITARLAARRELYEAIPRRINTTDLTVEEVAERIVAFWQESADRRLP